MVSDQETSASTKKKEKKRRKKTKTKTKSKKNKKTKRYLDENNFTGSIPTELGNLVNLQYLWVNALIWMSLSKHTNKNK